MESTQKEFDKRFKAKVALEATGQSSTEALAQKYDLSSGLIDQWVQQLEERAELLFLGRHAADQTEAIHNHAALLHTTLEASPNGIVVADLQQNVITHNQKCVSMWDVPEHLLATGDMDKIIAYALKQVKNADDFKESIAEARAHPSKELRSIVELKDGRFLERHSVPYRANGRILGRITNFVDITRYKKTEAKLGEKGNLLHSINTNVNEGILRSTPEQGLIYVNDAFVEMFGYESKEEVLATNPEQFYQQEAYRWDFVKKLQTDGRFYNEEVFFKRKDGSGFWGLENSTLVESDGQTYIDSVITDIDDWKKAEQALRKSEEKYRTILKTIEEGYFETDLQGDFTFFNAALIDIIGYPAEDVIGMNNRLIMSEKTGQTVYEAFNKVYRTGKPNRGFDWELIRGDGERIFVEVSIKIRANEDGEPIGFRGMVRDVTERKKKQRQLQQSLKEKEVLLGEIHHRVKNNLAVISGLLYLQADKTEDQKASRALMQSQNRINSMALIHELLYDNKTFSSIDPNTYVRQLVEHIASNFSHDCMHVETRIEADNFDLEMSTAIPCALIINELLTNAFKYAFDEGDDGLIQIVFRKKDHDRYYLEVIDNGRGLPEGFDLKDSSQHSLGLSLVKTLSRQLHGDLQVDSSDGTRFTLDFSAS